MEPRDSGGGAIARLGTGAVEAYWHMVGQPLAVEPRDSGGGAKGKWPQDRQGVLSSKRSGRAAKMAARSSPSPER